MTGTDLAVLLEPGATFAFPEHPFGPRPWRSFDHWTGTQVLQLYRADLTDRALVERFNRQLGTVGRTDQPFNEAANPSPQAGRLSEWGSSAGRPCA